MASQYMTYGNADHVAYTRMNSRKAQTIQYGDTAHIVERK